MKKIILASSSPRRKRLLSLLGIKFLIVMSNFDESSVKISNPVKFAQVLSRKKVEAVAKREKNAIIIGADTIVVIGKKILGKPKDEKDAVATLRLLSGKWQRVITGYTLMDTSTNIIKTSSVTSYVKFRKLSNDEILDYVATGEPKGRAGSYSIESLGGVLVKEIKGDFFNVVGLPVKDVRKALNKMGIKTII